MGTQINDMIAAPEYEQHHIETAPLSDTRHYHVLMTEEELIKFLRIPEVSSSKDYHNVIENLKRMHDLPRIRICGKPLYPRQAVLKWIDGKTTT